MVKYRLISKWASDYFPQNYRQDGKPQERIELLGLPSREEALHELNYFNKHLSNGAWIAERYEVDDGKYICFELIMPEKSEPIELINQPESLSCQEVFGPTKTIYVAKYIATQRNLNPNIQKINGRITPDERAKIYDDFNNNLIMEISVTESVARVGGVKYDANGKEIKIEFLDDIDSHSRECILNKINKKYDIKRH